MSTCGTLFRVAVDSKGKQKSWLLLTVAAHCESCNDGRRPFHAPAAPIVCNSFYSQLDRIHLLIEISSGLRGWQPFFQYPTITVQFSFISPTRIHCFSSSSFISCIVNSFRNTVHFVI